jgi:muconate cycloisomerase
LKFRFETLTLEKLHPLAISRGVSTGSENLFVQAESGGLVGIGELAPATASEYTSNRGRAQLEAFVAEGIEGLSIHEVWQAMRESNLDPPAMAALNVALWDLHAKRCGMPLYRVLGLGKPTVPTSVTVGINPPDVIRERVPELLSSTGGRYLKVKLGSPEGTEADQARFEAAREAASPFGVKIRVDANGGWAVSDAIRMCAWLAERGVDYVEQPLVEGAEQDLPALFEGRPLPIFVDESCRFASDVPGLADRVDGVNLKLMKCGGITEALRIVATSRAHGLKTMIGCMGESSVAIAAGASIGALFDHIDLDSHFNLKDDPAEGLAMVQGVVTPPESPGHGASLKPNWLADGAREIGIASP